jgi:hypothetical protein
LTKARDVATNSLFCSLLLRVQPELAKHHCQGNDAPSSPSLLDVASFIELDASWQQDTTEQQQLPINDLVEVMTLDLEMHFDNFDMFTAPPLAALASLVQISS